MGLQKRGSGNPRKSDLNPHRVNKLKEYRIQNKRYKNKVRKVTKRYKNCKKDVLKKIIDKIVKHRVSYRKNNQE